MRRLKIKTELEKYLWDNIIYAGEGVNYSFEEYEKKTPRFILNEMLINGLINNYKQGLKTLEKWCKKGLYDYGCCLDLGWKIKQDV